MKLLFEIDKKDYDINGRSFSRPSARGIIFRDGKLAVIYSRRKKYCKLPGGGIEAGEDNVTAMIREVHEETGLRVIPSTVREFGYVHRIQKGKHEPVFIQDNFYYFCDVEDIQDETDLSDAEEEEDFVPMFMDIDEAIRINREFTDSAYSEMTERELRVMGLIKNEVEKKL